MEFSKINPSLKIIIAFFLKGFFAVNIKVSTPRLYFFATTSSSNVNCSYVLNEWLRSTYSFTKKYPVDFDGELKIGDVRYDNMT